WCSWCSYSARPWATSRPPPAAWARWKHSSSPGSLPWAWHPPRRWPQSSAPGCSPTGYRSCPESGCSAISSTTASFDQHRRRRRCVLVTGDTGQRHTLPVRGDGEPPLGDRGPAGLIPARVGGGDLDVEPARPELVDGPAASLGLVVKAGPEPGGGVEEPHPPTALIGGCRRVLPSATGHESPDREGCVVVAQAECVQAVSPTSTVSVSATTSATTARATRCSGSCINEMVALTRSSVAVPSGPTASAHHPAGVSPLPPGLPTRPPGRSACSTHRPRNAA